jgi:hypothetical protein
VSFLGLQSAPGPAAASKIAQLYRDSQAEESLFEKIIRERGDKLPSISIPRVRNSLSQAR